jgi:glucosylceramidase
MRNFQRLALLSFMSVAACSGAGGADVGSVSEGVSGHSTVRVWITSDPSSPFRPQPDLELGAASNATDTIEVLDGPSNQHQEVDGFGAALTDASAAIMHYQLTDAERDALLVDLLSPTSGLGLDILRVPIAASDSTWSGAYSYDTGSPDPSLARFSIAHDEEYILPTLERILTQVNPDVHVIATPWSPPAWMKGGTSSMVGGHLLDQYREAYAEYFVKFVRAYWEHHVPIYAITPQNEPGQAADYPSMTLDADDEASFIVNQLSPALDRANFAWVKIFGFDHNWGDPYPGDLLGNADARKILSGIAFHCYGGDHSAAMTALHDQMAQEWNTQKDIYVTECDRSVTDQGVNKSYAEGIQKLIRAMRNWSRSYNSWQLVLHPDGTPNQGHGCMGSDWHCVGVVSVDPSAPEGKRVIHEWDYAYLGHASKFVPRGAVRIDSGAPGDMGNGVVGSIEHVAFQNPDGTRVLVAYNTASTEGSVQVSWHGSAFTLKVPARSAATATW